MTAATAKDNQAAAFTLSAREGLLTGKHVDFSTRASQGNENEYYKKVDPGNQRLTYAGWLNVNGFNNSNLEEVEAIYYNDVDLGLGR